jgi:hypothetical protein
MQSQTSSIERNLYKLNGFAECCTEAQVRPKGSYPLSAEYGRKARGGDHYQSFSIIDNLLQKV